MNNIVFNHKLLEVVWDKKSYFLNNLKLLQITSLILCCYFKLEGVSTFRLSKIYYYCFEQFIYVTHETVRKFHHRSRFLRVFHSLKSSQFVLVSQVVSLAASPPTLAAAASSWARPPLIPSSPPPRVSVSWDADGEVPAVPPHRRRHRLRPHVRAQSRSVPAFLLPLSFHRFGIEMLRDRA